MSSYFSFDLTQGSRIIGCLLLSLILSFTNYAQQPFFTTPQGINVCQTATIHAGLLNDQSGTLKSIDLTLDLPYGLKYIPGSVEGISEADIASLNRPKFVLDSLLPGDSIAMEWNVQVTCQTVSCIDAGELFQHSLIMDNGNFLSPIYNIETGYPLVHKIENPLMEAAKGDVITRWITIKNTRPGTIESLEFTDRHSQGIDVSFPGYTELSSDSVHTKVRIEGSDFSSIGNGNETFDFNEEIRIMERIEINTCAYDQRSAKSKLIVKWGCDSSYCHSYTRRAKVKIEAAFDEGDILGNRTWLQEVYCKMGGDIARQRLELRHNGSESDIYNL